jgi:hypothetical protein
MTCLTKDTPAPGNPVDVVLSRVNALREQLFRGDLREEERAEISELVAVWRLRLAALLQAQA